MSTSVDSDKEFDKVVLVCVKSIRNRKEKQIPYKTHVPHSQLCFLMEVLGALLVQRGKAALPPTSVPS